MAVHGLLFDFDGLILDTESPSRAAWQEIYRRHGHELPLDRWATVIGTIGAEFSPIGHLEELAGPLDRAEVLAGQREHELALCELEELRPGLLDYLREARRLHLVTAVVSSSSRAWVDGHLTRLKHVSSFEAIVTADGDPKRAKPQPTLYLEALDRLGLGPEEAIAFEDSPNGIRAAKAAGIVCVGVPNPVTASLGLEEADLVVESLADVPLGALLERLSR